MTDSVSCEDDSAFLGRMACATGVSEVTGYSDCGMAMAMFDSTCSIGALGSCIVLVEVV